MRNVKRFSWSGLFLIFFPFSVSAQDTEESQKIQEYNLISQRLSIVQQQALADDEIVKKSDAFAKKLESEMIKKNPEVKEKLEHRNSIISDYDNASKMNDEKKMLDLEEEFKTLSGEILIHQMEAMQNSELRDEGDKLEAAVLGKMQELDPEVPQLIARLESLEKQLKETEKEFIN
ncbi:MAG: hypothetical protein ACM339_04270 [Ignavibacteria bacterium]